MFHLPLLLFPFSGKVGSTAGLLGLESVCDIYPSLSAGGGSLCGSSTDYISVEIDGAAQTNQVVPICYIDSAIMEYLYS